MYERKEAEKYIKNSLMIGGKKIVRRKFENGNKRECVKREE